MQIDCTKVAPAAIKALGIGYGYIMQSGLDEALVELAHLRVPQIDGRAYCTNLNTSDLTRRRVAYSRLALVEAWCEAADLFDDLEPSAVQWAESVTLVAETGIPDDDFVAVSAVFSEREVADLTIAIGLMNTFNRE